ncbi:ribonuclease domain-containing protein [Amycolatopsis minnesotensis]|uniref:Ribonuclease domain-containing protein n=1 Tax=Amycolatopsis minnesotensis TaxID=337894 RepID=A0ABP5BQH2_9PSEU
MVNRRRKRITAALIGLIVLVVGGWLIKDAVSDKGTGGTPSSSAATPSSSAPAAGADNAGKSSRLPGSDSGLAVKPLSGLPSQAKDTWGLIRSDGPYPYPRNDGVTWQNREKRLPGKESGYYREYTVKTPGSRDRGARRLIFGKAHELYYTEDHYGSFVVVDPNR